MKHIAKLLLASTIVMTLLVGPAAAHIRQEGTIIKLKASPNPVQQGTGLTFTATLSSDWKKCYSQRNVGFYRNGVKQVVKGTNTAGIATIHIKATNTAKWYAKFNGRKWGKHPHKHVCFPSKSNTIKVKVT